jgi:cob(I)alamin adenosyltransferase
MFYTRKGDDGKTIAFGCDQRFSKSSIIAEALGSLDELNSYLGITKSKVQSLKSKAQIQNIQENIFIIQAQVAGADKIISEEKIKAVEKIIDDIEKEISPLKSFIIPGANEISAMFDFARTLARKTERRVVAVLDEKLIVVDENTLKYLNRLSSLLFAFARFSALEKGITENHPKYS